MTLTALKGDGPILMDLVTQQGGTPAFQGAPVIDASAEKIAIVGCVWHPTVKTGTINIRKVHFRTGTVTFNAASTMRVSLQNISATAGPPYQPDGTQDQTYDFAGAGLTANSWISTGNLSADRAVDLSADSFGDANSRWLAIVFEYQTFTAADSIVINSLLCITGPGSSMNTLLGGNTLINTAAWAASTGSLSVTALECDDGTFAFLEGCLPVSALSNASVASNGAIRAAGLKFRFPVEVKVDAFSLMMAFANGADGSLIVYDSDGTTELASISIDNDAVISTAARNGLARTLPITFAANTYYRLVFVASTTTATAVHYLDVNAAGLMDGLMGGQDFHWTERDSGGTWTDTTTRRPHFIIKLSSIHDGSGGGGMLQGNLRGNFQ